MNFRDYTQRVAGTDNMSRIAKETGLTQTNVSRQITTSARSLTFDTVAAVARTYRRPLLEALVAADFISQAEADAELEHGGLRTCTDQELADEFLRRMDAATESETLDNVRELHPQADINELAAHKGEDGIAPDDTPHEP